MLCWLQVKGHIKEHNKKFTLSAVNNLIYDGFFWRVENLNNGERTSVMSVMLLIN